MLSSQIEGTQSSLSDLLLFEHEDGRVGERRLASRGVADCCWSRLAPPSNRACGSPAHGVRAHDPRASARARELSPTHRQVVARPTRPANQRRQPLAFWDAAVSLPAKRNRSDTVPGNGTAAAHRRRAAEPRPGRVPAHLRVHAHRCLSTRVLRAGRLLWDGFAFTVAARRPMSWRRADDRKHRDRPWVLLGRARARAASVRRGGARASEKGAMSRPAPA